MNLQAVLLVKEEEGTRIWLCGITIKLLITYLSNTIFYHNNYIFETGDTCNNEVLNYNMA